MTINSQEHWNHIYKTKMPNEVSWTEETPTVSLEFIHAFHVPKDAKIIDIGGGDSKLVDHLLREGYFNISVLDISSEAIERAKKRLGEDAHKVNWIVSDILEFQPIHTYDLWHDRAAFHFQTDTKKIHRYLDIVKRTVNGMVIVGTFSVDGPSKCSGLEIRQYDEDSMKVTFEKSDFKNIECKREDHITPAGAIQNFIFCSFMKNEKQKTHG